MMIDAECSHALTAGREVNAMKMTPRAKSPVTLFRFIAVSVIDRTGYATGYFYFSALHISV